MNIGRRRKQIRGQGGQAIAELAVCLIVLVICFVGFLLTGAITQKRVSNIILSRTDADKILRTNASGSGEAKNILAWDYGGDEELGLPPVPFTSDDREILNGRNPDYLFTGQLRDNTGMLSLNQISTDSIPEATNAARFLSRSPIFLQAADLIRGESHNPDPLSEKHLSSLKAAVSNLFHIDSFQLSDDTYLPRRATVPLPEDAK